MSLVAASRAASEETRLEFTRRVWPASAARKKRLVLNHCSMYSQHARVIVLPLFVKNGPPGQNEQQSP